MTDHADTSLLSARLRADPVPDLHLGRTPVLRATTHVVGTALVEVPSTAIPSEFAVAQLTTDPETQGTPVGPKGNETLLVGRVENGRSFPDITFHVARIVVDHGIHPRAQSKQEIRCVLTSCPCTRQMIVDVFVPGGLREATEGEVQAVVADHDRLVVRVAATVEAGAAARARAVQAGVP